MDNITNHAHVLFNLLKDKTHTIGCEVGVHTGDTTIFLLDKLPKIKKYYTIDPWESYVKYDGELYRKPGHKKIKTWVDAKVAFFNKIKLFKKKVIPYQMTSVDAVKLFKNESLDWIFIDVNHEYEYIKENLELWLPKIKVGGVVSGHDYGNKWKGIKKAVDEFVPAEKLNIEPFCVWWYIK